LRQVLVGKSNLTKKTTKLNQADWADFCLREERTYGLKIYKGFEEAQQAQCIFENNYFGTCVYMSDKIGNDDVGEINKGLASLRVNYTQECMEEYKIKLINIVWSFSSHCMHDPHRQQNLLVRSQKMGVQ